MKGKTISCRRINMNKKLISRLKRSCKAKKEKRKESSGNSAAAWPQALLILWSRDWQNLLALKKVKAWGPPKEIKQKVCSSLLVPIQRWSLAVSLFLLLFISHHYYNMIKLHTIWKIKRKKEISLLIQSHCPPFLNNHSDLLLVNLPENV